MLNHFLNIPLQETIDLCVKPLFNDKSTIDGFTITDFHQLLTVTISESLVLFDGEYYFIKDMLMTPSCYFHQKTILKNSDVTLIANILILSLHLK